MNKNVDKITVKELEDLGKVCRKEGLTVQQWKVLVKEFAIEHGLSDREAILLANKAQDNF